MKADPGEDDTFLFVKSEFSVTYQAVEEKKFFVNSFTVKSFHAMIIFITTGGAPIEVIKKYIESQGQRDRKRK